MNTNGIEIYKNSSPLQMGQELRLELEKKNVNVNRLANKLSELLDAKTHDNKGNVIEDNKSQLDALKLALKIHGMKTDSGININLFSIPGPNEDIRY